MTEKCPKDMKTKKARAKNLKNAQSPKRLAGPICSTSAFESIENFGPPQDSNPSTDPNQPHTVRRNSPQPPGNQGIFQLSTDVLQLLTNSFEFLKIGK